MESGAKEKVQKVAPHGHRRGLGNLAEPAIVQQLAAKHPSRKKFLPAPLSDEEASRLTPQEVRLEFEMALALAHLHGMEFSNVLSSDLHFGVAMRLPEFLNHLLQHLIGFLRNPVLGQSLLKHRVVHPSTSRVLREVVLK